MADFYAAVPKILELEGGFQNHESDKGNYNAYDSNGNRVPYSERPGRTLRAGTNWGISTAWYSAINRREVSEAEMRALTKSEALKIYKTYFWDTIKGDHIQDQRLAELIFDAKVNMGSGIKLLQKVLNALGNSLEVDGVIGPQTLAAINKAPVATLYNKFRTARADLYQRIVQKDPTQGVFLNGWLNRLKKFPLLKEGVNGKAVAVGVGIIGLIYLLADNE